MKQPAFDSLAPYYDHTFTHTAIGRWLRGRVHARLNLRFRAGQSVLELGCGTGEDALHLANQGVRVTATDISPQMLDAARAKIGAHPLVRLVELDLQELMLGPGERSSPAWRAGLEASGGAPTANLRDDEIFDGAFSNFGPLNVLDDWQPLARWLASRVRPGGVVALGVMGPLCLWEIGWHGLHLDFRTAARRLRGRSTFRPGPDSEPIAIYYPGIRRLERDFSRWFRRVEIDSLGLFLPPSDVYGVIEKRPRLMHALMNLEKQFGMNDFLARFADHYWIEFERVEETKAAKG